MLILRKIKGKNKTIVKNQEQINPCLDKEYKKQKGYGEVRQKGQEGKIELERQVGLHHGAAEVSAEGH